jgi:hypothetical protein
MSHREAGILRRENHGRASGCRGWRVAAVVACVTTSLQLLPLPAGAADAPALAADRARLDAQVRGDVDALDKCLGADLTYVHSSGVVETKDQFLGGIKSGKYKYKAVTTEGVTVRSYGDTAVLGGKATIDVVADGKDLHVVLRFTDVWVKRDGRWQMVAWHSTRLNP